jgi:transcriptional regulator with XRE-family HTH domain
MQNLQDLKNELGLSGSQRARLLHISPSLLSHIESGRRMLNTLSQGYFEQAIRIWLKSKEAQAGEDLAFRRLAPQDLEKQIKRLELELDKKKSELEKLKTSRTTTQNRLAFAENLFHEPEIGPRPHQDFCRALIEEAHAELALFSPLGLAQKEAQIKGLEAELGYWRSLR